MSRLASLTPAATPSRARGTSQSPAPSPSASTPRTPRSGTPSRQTETTYHRMTKLIITELKSLFKTWDEVSLVDGVKAGKGCIDEATEMDNILALQEGDERPSVTPHLEKLYDSRIAMEAAVSKMEKALAKLVLLLEQAEKVFFDAYRTQGAEFVLQEPLWLSWTLEHFVNSLPPLLTAHNTQLILLTALSRTMVDPKTSFDDAKLALERWRDLSIRGERWNIVRDWEELVDLELTGAGEAEADEEDDAERGTKKSKKKKK
ncbi:hypothetical protein DB88DRAFT_45337 [Papiliotrema laurentii]|uniref:Uncharacterized protein n=1 Tax=Papiliotrema laurentii TaxID=5418 RepID=A0AAD9FX07_PAPLA|nr:hypothetical protein DB88DRAFT_45337 [Papiliotrema laurentii]